MKEKEREKERKREKKRYNREKQREKYIGRNARNFKKWLRGPNNRPPSL